MSSTTAHSTVEAAHPHRTIKVHVTFPLGHGRPYQADYKPETTIATVLADAMAHFRVHADSGTRYYLTHGEHDDPVDETAPLGSVVGHPHRAKFTLVKELIQG